MDDGWMTEGGEESESRGEKQDLWPLMSRGNVISDRTNYFLRFVKTQR